MQKKHFLIEITLLCIIAVMGGIFLVSYINENKPEDEDYNKAFTNSYFLYAPPIPAELTFCGEPVPLDRYDVREALDRELLVNVYWQSNIILYCKRAYRYFPAIEAILKEQGIPEDFKYLALIESGLMNVVSPSKAVGFWQIMKSTGISYGLEINDEVDQRYSLSASTEAACKYLKNSYRQQGSWTAAAAAYNMGDGGYRRSAANQHTANYWDLLLNSETSRYVYRILAAKIILSNLPDYGIHLRIKDLYPPIPSKQIYIDTAVGNWVDFALSQGITYKQLRTFNPWIQSDHLSNKNHTSYTITLPLQEYSDYHKLISELSNKDDIIKKL
ncbi:MAG: lytic transglycosylase domain-containing protein [Bacteroidales bacterium]|nr:lytic transglycosylase domain-containing protein [Bacteroidales bacterium]